MGPYVISYSVYRVGRCNLSMQSARIEGTSQPVWKTMVMLVKLSGRYTVTHCLLHNSIISLFCYDYISYTAFIIATIPVHGICAHSKCGETIAPDIVFFF